MSRMVKEEATIDVIEQLTKMLELYEVEVVRIGTPEDYKKTREYAIRMAMGESLDLENQFENAINNMKKGDLVIAKDDFGVETMSFLLDENENPEMIKIGPMVEKHDYKILDDLECMYERSADYREELKRYYFNIPEVEPDIIKEIVLLHMRYIFEEVTINRLGVYYNRGNVKSKTKYNIYEQYNEQNVEEILQAYKNEDELISAVRSGDMERVLHVRRKFKKVDIQEGGDISIEKEKRYLLVQNTLFRKAVQKEAVHPLYIHKLSEQLSDRIIKATTQREIMEIGDDIIRKYCMLIRNHSLKGYSDLIMRTLNYIEFNIRENLKLNVIAEELNVNASYLSNKFKKETGRSLTEYVNSTRIEKTYIYLATSDESVSSIAERVGICDENYFAKIFKKQSGMSPSDYRRLMQTK